MSNRFKEVRKKLKLKQSDVAKALNVSVATYSRYEVGEFKPDMFKLCKMADIYSVSVDYLLMRTNIPYMMESDEQDPNTDFIIKYNALGQRSKNMINMLLDHEYKLLSEK